MLERKFPALVLPGDEFEGQGSADAHGPSLQDALGNRELLACSLQSQPPGVFFRAGIRLLDYLVVLSSHRLLSLDPNEPRQRPVTGSVRIPGAPSRLQRSHHLTQKRCQPGDRSPMSIAVFERGPLQPYGTDSGRAQVAGEVQGASHLGSVAVGSDSNAEAV